MDNKRISEIVEEEMIKQTRCYGCDKREALTVTMPMEEFDKLEKLALSAHTDKLSWRG